MPHSHTHHWHPRKKGEKEWHKNIIQDIKDKNFPKLMKLINTQIQEYLQTPIRINTKEFILKAVRRALKNTLYTEEQ